MRKLSFACAVLLAAPAMAQAPDMNGAALGEELMSCHAGHAREKINLRVTVKQLEAEIAALKKAAEKP